jgi:hypothetical protein
MFKAAPYLRMAKAANEEKEFFLCFFKFWFERWPETPTEEDNISVERCMELVKKVGNILAQLWP